MNLVRDVSVVLSKRFFDELNPDDPGRAVRDFRSKSFLPALKVIAEIYPDAKFEVSPGGLILHPSKPHVAFVDRQYNLFTDKP